jgi:arginine deiminase
LHEETFQVFPCRLYEAGRPEPRYVMFQEYLAQRDIHVIPITTAERRGGHLNVVVTQRARKAVGFAGATRIEAEMERLGWTLSTFPAEELFLGNGGVHCMTCPLLVC